jgi:hypothetical protein
MATDIAALAQLLEASLDPSKSRQGQCLCPADAIAVLLLLLLLLLFHGVVLCCVMPCHAKYNAQLRVPSPRNRTSRASL